MALPLKKLIEICEANIDLIPSEHHGFVSDMAEARKTYGELQTVTYRQMRYLSKLVGQFCPRPVVSTSEPKSKIEQLREKRDKLLSRARRSAARQRWNENGAQTAVVRLKAGELRVEDKPTARVKHDKSHKRDKMKSKLVAHRKSTAC